MKVFELIKDTFSSFSERAKLFLIVFTFSIIAVVLSIWIGGIFAAALITVPLILGILQATKDIWSPDKGSKSKVALASIGFAILIIVSGGLSQQISDTLLDPLYKAYPALKGNLPSAQPSVLTLAFVAIVIFIVNYFSRDTSAMKEHPTPIEKEFPEKNYKDLLRLFCEVLLDDLRNIDRETNWSAELFIPLDAEVEVHGRGKGRGLKRITDLLAAIKLDRITKTFLVLGDPGSGKSVALRKLCRELLAEVDATGKVPIYINLKEWSVKKKWSESNVPTVEQLYEFVVTNLKSRGDVFTGDFIEKYFKRMFEDGRLFLVLDSFDEIPAVLDEAENSWLIDELSSVIYRFLSGAHQSRGVLASRIFRRPTDAFDAKTTLEIRPLSEKKIVQTLKKSLSFEESLVHELFTRRRELVPVARNPFLAALVSTYAKEHDNQLPSTQAELYESYIRRRLNSCEDRISNKGLTQEKVFEVAIEIAHYMFTSETLGLEVSVRRLSEALPSLPIADVVDVLTYGRLGRLGAGTEQRFSFVHRRFNEYLVVQKLMQTSADLRVEDIPRDSRWRDALVLFCEVTNEAEATHIAEFCWSEIRKIKNLNLSLHHEQYLRSIHCLRFLKDAYRARIHCIDSFRDELAALIIERIKSDENILSKKLAVEAVGLLRERDIESATLEALKLNNPWISDTALKSCYFLPKLSTGLNTHLKVYIDSLDIERFLRQREELMFSFKLSNIFFRLRTFCILRSIDVVSLLVLSVLVFLTSPLLLVVVILIFSMQREFLLGYPKKLTVAEVAKTRLATPTSILTASIITTQVKGVAAITPIHFPSVGFNIPHVLWIGLFLAIPWYQVYAYREDIIEGFRKLKASTNIKDVLRGVGYIVLVGGLIIVILIAVIFLLSKVIPKELLPYFTAVMGVYVIWSYTKDYVKNFYRRVIDNRRTETFFREPSNDRGSIADHFYGLKTEEGRLYFVRQLQDKKLKPRGVWPDKKLPNVNNDYASILLAQLEEKWLGLDR